MAEKHVRSYANNFIQAPSYCVNGTEITDNEGNFEKIKQKYHIPIFGGNYILLNFGKVMKNVLIDTGASISMVSLALLRAINPNLIPKVVKTNVNTATLVNGSPIDLIGQIQLNFFLNKTKVSFQFYVISKMNFWAILGLDFFQKYSCTILNIHSLELAQ